MVDKITLGNISNQQALTSSAATINSNNALITTAMDNTLSRDGTQPNQMMANLDMNSNQILNLPAPTTSLSPLRVADATALTTGSITFNNVPTGGTSGQVLTKNSSSNYDMSWKTTRLPFVNVLDYGADNTGVLDCSTAFINAFSALNLNQGGTIFVPPGTYNFSNPVIIPAFVEPASITVIMTGATLSTTASIKIFQRLPPDQNTALNVWIGAEFHFVDGTFQGNNTSGQMGIFLGATYASTIKGTKFFNLDVGLDLSFCLAAHVYDCRGLQNSTCMIRVETGVGWWTGASTGNSASNATTIEGCRDYCNLGQTASFIILACDGVQILQCISEGAVPTDNIRFDDQSTTTVKSFTVDGFHSENGPTNSILKLIGIGGGTITCRQFANQAGGASNGFVDASQYDISNIVFEDCYNTPTFNSTGVSEPKFWYLRGLDGGATVYTNPAYWIGGSPPNMFGVARDSNGVGTAIYCTTSLSTGIGDSSSGNLTGSQLWLNGSSSIPAFSLFQNGTRTWGVDVQGYPYISGRAITTSPFSVSANTTPANIPGLSVSGFIQGASYKFRANIIVSSMATAGGVNVTIGGTMATAGGFTSSGWAMDTGTTPIHGYSQSGTVNTAGFTNTATTVILEGTFICGSPGTLTIQFAQNTSNATASVVAAGSTLMVERMA